MVTLFPTALYTYCIEIIKHYDDLHAPYDECELNLSIIKFLRGPDPGSPSTYIII